VSRKIEDGKYFGELSGRLKYKDRIGPLFSELFVDPETLTHIASAEGWDSNIIAREDQGHYLARLSPSKNY
jgi:hypothetical protein